MSRDGAAPAADAKTLDLRLSERIERDIMSAAYAPGERLREQDLAVRYGASRPSVREALRTVAQSGFVEIQPWRGAQVIELGHGELLQLTALMEEAYAICAGQAARKASSNAIDELKQRLTDLEAAVAGADDRNEIYRLSFAIGRCIGLASESRHAFRQLVQSGNLVLWQHRLLRPGDRLSDVQSLHAYHVLVSAVERRQAEAAAAAARLIIILMRNLFDDSPIWIV